LRAPSRVMAFVRVKPTAHFAQDMIRLGADNKSIDIYIQKNPRGGVVNNSQTDWSFKLDGVLHNTSQEMVYDTVAKDLVCKALQGYNGTIMCYGQTGAGKTYTMTGAASEYRNRGIIPRAIQQVFKSAATFLNILVTVRISYLEIYNEALFDLLAPALGRGCKDSQLCVMDGPQGVYVKGLSIHPVSHEEEALHLLFEGETNRVIGEHSLNKNSSRSHCIFTMYLECRSRDYTNHKCLKSKITLIDLAGSERLSKTGSEGQVRVEAAYINKSLSFLEQLIIALADPKREHMPFRQSKLTHVLKDSLGKGCHCPQLLQSWTGQVLSSAFTRESCNGLERAPVSVSAFRPLLSKQQAFEVFKKEAGQEIHRIFRDNKRILIAKKKASHSVAQRLNSLKEEVETTKEALEAQKKKRRQEGEEGKGQVIIDENEFSLIVKLKELKEEHRAGFSELKDLKAEIQYCQHLVDKCRKRLISEFEIWYNENYRLPKDVKKALEPGGNIRPGMIPINRVMSLDEDEQDKFEQVQEKVLPDCPGSVSFYRARMRTDQKVTPGRVPGWIGMEGTFRIIQTRAETPPTIPGCSRPCPTWAEQIHPERAGNVHLEKAPETPQSPSRP
uniref:Kinesin-like protein n=1 Tax=Zonotrichia albicollis TaxID=44394 RepID=A0A8D2MMU3_ZONAL